MESCIAIIPARSGSKRIKNKNIKLFHGKPIIYWSIKAALESKCFDRVLVSTDSEKIKKISIKYGAEVPFIRPKKISDDYATTQEVISYSLKKLYSSTNLPNYVCCIYPCAPMIEPKDLKNAYRILKKNKKQMIFPVWENPYTLQKAIILNNNKAKFLFSKQSIARSQDLQKTFFDAGQYYFGTSKQWLKGKNPIHNSNVIIVNNNKAIDINSLNDWKYAEKIFKLK